MKRRKFCWVVGCKASGYRIYTRLAETAGERAASAEFTECGRIRFTVYRAAQDLANAINIFAAR